MSTLTTVGPAIPSMNVTRLHRVIESPLGELTLVTEAEALTGVYFAHHRGRPGPAALGSRDDTILDEAATQLGEYFAGTR
ncbi:MAG: cysteine methyltransferase, partial [Modestobacter sp.]|nr:cysteine methyltransferase [Modestobacter sp.]